jgi:hypothetical protein
LGLRVSARSHEGFERAEKAFQIEADDAIALDVRAVRHGLARTLIEAVRAGRRGCVRCFGRQLPRHRLMLNGGWTAVDGRFTPALPAPRAEA